MKRKTIRLSGYDYSQTGYYFITICVDKKLKLLSKIENNISVLNRYGFIVEELLKKIPTRHSFLKIHQYVIMPNHIHFILEASDIKVNSYKKNISAIIGAFKSQATKKIRFQGLNDFHWQRSFYDRIIRDDIELFFVMEYIENNPSNSDKNTLKDFISTHN